MENFESYNDIDGDLDEGKFLRNNLMYKNKKKNI